jgi:serine/threonine protein kinase
MSRIGCPQQDEIAAYMVGEVDDDKLNAVSDHLAHCPRCQAAADALESSVSDPLVELLGEPLPADDFSGEPECQQIFPKIKTGNTRFDTSNTSGEGSADGDLLLPVRLGEYHVLERIGGHMGAVYRALHTTLDRFVALKILPAQALADDQVVSRFQQEMKAVGRLEHPNIVRAYDAREIDEKHVLVMELVEGKNIAEVVESRGRLTVADACETVRQAAVGLQYVHEKGLVHRDVKPSNLMLTPEGQVKILDLGLARFRTRQPSDHEMTRAGQAVGTPHYMAPEQVTDSRTADTRADVYGLGCTLYRLLSGRAPYDEPRYEDALDVLTAHLAEPVPSIREVRPDTPDALAAVLDQMLAKSPSDRFETPGQVAAALEPFAQGCDLRALAAPWESRTPSKAQPTPPFPWFWRLIGTAAILLVLVVGGKTAAQRLAPLWDNEGEDSVAMVPEASPDRPPQAAPSEPPADGPKHRKQDPVPATEGKSAPNQAPTPTVEPKKPLPAKEAEPKKPAPPKRDSRDAADQLNRHGPAEQKPPAPAVGPGPVKSPPGKAPADRPSTQTPAKNEDWLADTRNPKAAFEVSVEVDHADRVYRGPPAGSDRYGEVVHVTVQSAKAGYLYLIYQSADGGLTCLYPNKVQQDNKIPADTKVAIPHPDARFRLRVGPPYGKELLKAVVTLAPRKPEDFGVASFTEGDFTPLQPPVLKSVFVELEKTPADWAEHRTQITTISGHPLSESLQPAGKHQDKDRTPPRPSREEPQQAQPSGTTRNLAAH